MRLLRLAAALALLVPLTACGGDEPAATASATPSPTSSSGTLVLRGDGLAFTETGGTTVLLPFGSSSDAVLPAVAAALGEPQPLAVRCGQGVRDTAGVNGFDVIFHEDRMVGWDESGAGLATDEGIKLGTTRQQLQQLLPDVVFETTPLGPEFRSATGLAGFLEGETPTSIVVGLTGGESCVVR